MKKRFKDMVRIGDVKSPVQKGFKVATWIKSWDESLKGAVEDENLYEAGVAIFKVLSEIRTNLANLYKCSAPKLSNSQLLKYFCALPNRDMFISNRTACEKGFEGKSIFCATLGNNWVNNELTLMEISNGCVDGIQKAIDGCNGRILKRINLVAGSDPVGSIDFVRREADLSQLYCLYESYWSALVWGDYEFNWIDKSNNFAEISQKATNYEVAHEISQIRRARLGFNSIHEAGTAMKLLDDAYVVTDGAGKNKIYKIERVKSASESIQYSNAAFKINAFRAFELFPAIFLNKRHLAGEISIIEILDVFRILVLLSSRYMEGFPEDDGIQNAKKLMEFCPVMNRQKLCTVVAGACQLSYSKAWAALEFLTYRDSVDDMWCHPLLESKSNQICLLVSALIAPNLIRVIEHWLVKLDVDLAEKGYVYEGNIVSDLNIALNRNAIICDYDQAKSMRIKLDSGEEQIDLLVRIGNVIIVGEAKSIVATDSTMSYYRTFKILEKASEQAKRKSLFVQNNIAEVIKRLGWKCDVSCKYDFIPLIINSNKMHVGFAVGGVPVCDEAILTDYFKKSIFPIFSTMNKGGPNHLAWFDVYDSSKTFCLNLRLYLNNPPQVSEDISSFELRATNVPAINDESLKLVYKRLLPKDASLNERLTKKYVFPLHVAPNIEDELARVDIVI